MKEKNADRLSRREFIRHGAATSAGLAMGFGISSFCTDLAAAEQARIRKTRSYNPEMEYRRLGKTGLWVSAVCLGGHWKRIDKVIGTAEINPYNAPADENVLAPFQKNRNEVIQRCLKVGINCIDLAGDSEAEVYSRALGKQRDQMYLAYSHPASELRVPENRKAEKLLELFKDRLRMCKWDYVDIWRLMAFERGTKHTQAEVDEMIKALEKARKQGLCRFTGCSTHDRKWARMLIETYPDIIQVLVIPYTANSKVLKENSFFDAIVKHDVGVLGIKPFGSNSIFKGDGSPNSPNAKEDDERARLTICYILSNPVVTAPIPGLISVHQVDNAVQAVKERREFDASEKAQLQQIRRDMHAQLTPDYEWLRDWDYV